MTKRQTQQLVETFYRELWNAWREELIEQLLHPRLAFTGSMGVETEGREEFRQYYNMVRGAFPDFNNRLDELVVEGNRAAARLTFRGTQLGPLFEHTATDREICYHAAAFFEVEDGKFRRIWVLGDRQALFSQLLD